MRKAILLLALCAASVQAQSSRDTVHVRAQIPRLDSVRVAMDSLHRWCLASYSSPKYLTKVCNLVKARPDRRLRPREDSLLMTPPPPPPPPPPPSTIATIEVVQTGPISTPYYASGIEFWPVTGVDTVTVCAVVEYADGQKKVGWPPARITVMGAARDSATMVLRGGNPLSQMCGPAVQGVTTVADSVPVAWGLTWLQITPNQRVLRPMAARSP